VELRRLTEADQQEALRFAVMAALPPWTEPTAEALRSAHVRRWLNDWGDEVGACWEDAGALVGAAWARHVEPIVALDRDGERLPEIIISVVKEQRRQGLGRALIEELQRLAKLHGWKGLALTVSEDNAAALKLYQSVNFTAQGRTDTGSLVMVWLVHAAET
jgi:ribosomal protein S18 acetylase RimI-like enzyme